MGFPLWLSLRYLVARRREALISVHSLFAVFGVAIGVAALITVIAVMTGFHRDLREKIIGVNSHLVISHAEGISEPDELIQEIAGLEGVHAVAPYVSGQAILKAGEDVTGIAFRGIDPGREGAVSGAMKYLRAGTGDFSDGYGIWVGSELARSLRLQIDSPCVLISPADGKERTFKVTGIFNAGMYEYDATLVFLSVQAAQEMLRLQDTVTGLSVRLNSLDQVGLVKGKLVETLGPYYWIRSWLELNQNLMSAIQIEKVVMFVILTLIVLVAAFNIASSLTMTVMEKTREIGILRALGATQGGVQLTFFFQGMWIGVIGLFMGTVAGLALTMNLNRLTEWLEGTFGFEVFPSSIYYFDTIPTEIQPLDIMVVVSSALLVTIIASLYPARHAAALEPVEALRYE